jgi:DNA polymerase III epsilon subunit-like protein
MMMKKLFFFDCETTGLDPARHDIIQLAYIIDQEQTIIDKGCFYIAPGNIDSIDPCALAVNGRTIDEISLWPKAPLVYRDLIDMLARHIDRYDSRDKFYPVAYNGNFDYSFLSAFFKRRDDPYFGAWFNHRLLDPMAIIRLLDFQGLINPCNHKLKTMAEYFKLSLPDTKFHDALDDVFMLRQLFYRTLDYISGSDRSDKSDKSDTLKEPL